MTDYNALPAHKAWAFTKDEVWNRCCEGATASDSGIDGLVAEYAAKLRLADDKEE